MEEEQNEKSGGFSAKNKTAKLDEVDSSKLVAKNEINPTATSSGVSEVSSQKKLSRALKERAVAAK